MTSIFGVREVIVLRYWRRFGLDVEPIFSAFTAEKLALLSVSV